MKARRTVILAERLVTCDPARATTSDPLGVLSPAFLILEGGRIHGVGAMHDLIEPPVSAEVIRADLVTPGLIDAHTHAAWMGSRHEEYALRLGGADYETIAKAGGGIVSTMRAVREASLEDITRSLSRRLARMVAQGVTTVEVKSGYGLDLENERKQLMAIRAVKSEERSPRLAPTYLALHALPPEANRDRDAYASRVASRELDALADEGLFISVDAYIDRSAFSAAQARPVLEKARARGFDVRVHIGQFADVGGAELAAELGARTVDHLEHVSDAGLQALARAGTRAVLLPVASFTLDQAPPNIAAIRAAGLRMIVASDANPGTAPTESLPLALAFAVRNYGLTVSEAILGATREAALSLGFDDIGVLRTGARADLVAWDFPHETCLVQPFGVPRARVVLREGHAIHARDR